MARSPSKLSLKDLSDQDLLEQVKQRLQVNKGIEKQIKAFLHTEP
jgi:hypothetical protein